MKITVGKSDTLCFYPEHPSNEKTRQIETSPSARLEQSAPWEVKELCDSVCQDLMGALEQYQDKRFEVTGVAVKVGPDIHHKPSIELSDRVGGQCYALCIFPTDEFYSQVSVGDKVTVCANYLVMSNWFGVVMKYSELVTVASEER